MDKNNSLVPLSSNTLIKVKNSIAITNKLLTDNSSIIQSRMSKTFSNIEGTIVQAIPVDKNHILLVTYGFDYDDINGYNYNCPVCEIILFDYYTGKIIRKTSFNLDYFQEYLFSLGSDIGYGPITLNYSRVQNIIVFSIINYIRENEFDQEVPYNCSVYSLNFSTFEILAEKVIQFPIFSAVIDKKNNYIWFNCDEKTIVANIVDLSIVTSFDYKITKKWDQWELRYFNDIKSWGIFVAMDSDLHSLLCINDKSNYPIYTIKKIHIEHDSIIKTSEFSLTEYKSIQKYDYSEHKKQLAFIDVDSKNIEIYDLTTNEIIQTIEFEDLQFYVENQEHCYDVAYSVDGKFLLLYFEGKVFIYETNKYTMIKNFLVIDFEQVAEESISNYSPFELIVKFSYNSKNIITIKPEKYLRVWEF